MEVFNKIETDLRAYYGTREFMNEDAARVGWKNKQAQLARFYQLLKVIDLETDFSINDLGCGIGDFYGFLKEKKTQAVIDYYGYDLLEEMINRAVDKYGTEKDAEFVQVKSLHSINNADFQIASGIFNLKYNASDKEWLDFIISTIELMYKKANRAIAFNCLTSYSDKEFMKSELYYTDPLFIFDYCKRNLSKEVCLIHDYGEYDFTVIVRKQIS